MELIKLADKSDLVKLVAGNIVGFGLRKEACLVYPYEGLSPSELFLIGRFPRTRFGGFIGVVFDDRDNLLVRDGFVELDHSTTPRFSDGYFKELEKTHSREQIGEMQKALNVWTRDGFFHYGFNFVAERVDDDFSKRYLNPVKFREFDDALKRVGM